MLSAHLAVSRGLKGSHDQYETSIKLINIHELNKFHFNLNVGSQRVKVTSPISSRPSAAPSDILYVTTRLDNAATSIPGGYATTTDTRPCLWLNSVL